MPSNVLVRTAIYSDNCYPAAADRQTDALSVNTNTDIKCCTEHLFVFRETFAI